MRVLITGGAGFIGSHVVDALIARGLEPAVFDDLSSGKRSNLPDRIPLHHADLRDAAAVTRAVDVFQPDAICHLAAQVSVSRSVREPVFDAEVNVLGTLNVLQAAVKAEVLTVAFASSGGALYGDVETPADEDHACLPISPYGIAKLTGERYLEFFAREHGLRGIALRFSNVYGPRQDPHGEAGVVAIFATKLLAGEVITINGDGKYVRDYVEVTDVARAVAAALDSESSEPFSAFNVGTAVGTDVNELADMMRRSAESHRAASGLTAPLPVPVHGPPRAGDLRSSLVSYERISQTLGWSPQKPLETGLRETIEWFAGRKHG